MVYGYGKTAGMSRNAATGSGPYQPTGTADYENENEYEHEYDCTVQGLDPGND